MIYTIENYNIIAGCDEAGRGCLAGPVFAAAVILPVGLEIEGIDDSKKLSHKQRCHYRDIIREKALDFAVASVDNETIDKINILNASILAMHKAIDKLTIKPDLIIVDGNRFKPYQTIPYQCFVKGDANYAQIAAASIMAKTTRDDFMQQIDKEFPMYHWHNNKGYPTREHANAIRLHGLCKYHRKTFNVPNQYSLF